MGTLKKALKAALYFLLNLLVLAMARLSLLQLPFNKLGISLGMSLFHLISPAKKKCLVYENTCLV